jgi:hypothetical protein
MSILVELKDPIFTPKYIEGENLRSHHKTQQVSIPFWMKMNSKTNNESAMNLSFFEE